MNRVPLPRPQCAVPRAATACAAASFTILLIASGCLAPTPAPEKPVPPSVPYGSMSASIAAGKPEEALQSYEKALAAAPQTTATRILHARLLLISGRLPEAREELNLVLATEPRNAGALYFLSAVAGMEENGDEQESLLRRAVEIDPGHPDALAAFGAIVLAKGDADGASAMFTRALARDPGNLAALLGQGSIHAQQDDWQGAEDFYTRAVTAQPDYSFAYIDRARARQSLGDTRGALEDLSLAIALDPAYPWSYIDRGKIFARLSRDDSAADDFSVAIRLDPGQFEGYALRAETRACAGDVEGALADWERVTILKPDYRYAYRPVGTLAWARGDWAKARAAFQRAYDFEPAEFSFLLCAALCSLREGKPTTAAPLLRQVLSQSPAESWYRDIARYLLDRSVDGNLLTEIDRERNAALKARMLFYVAVVYLTSDMNRAGLTYLLQTDGRGAPNAVETELARTELARQNPP